MLVASSLKKLLLLFQYPRFSPTLSGEHNVGTLKVRIPGSVACQVHYPTEQHESSSSWTFGAYFRTKAINGLADYTGTSSNLLSFLSSRQYPYPVGAKILVEKGDGSNDSGFPVIVFSHGLGGCMEMYSQLCSHMASHGYIVLAVEHQDGSGCFAETAASADDDDGGEPIYYRRPDNTPYSREKVLKFRGPMLEQRLKEIESTMKYLLKDENTRQSASMLESVLASVDLRRGISLVGHSFGAATMTLVAQRGTYPINTVAFLDPWCFSLPDEILKKGVTSVPVVTILSEEWTRSKELPQVLTLLENSSSVSSNNNNNNNNNNNTENNQSWWMPGAVHQSVADSANWLPTFLARRMYMRGKKERRFETSRAAARVCVKHILQQQQPQEALDEEYFQHPFKTLVKPFVLPSGVGTKVSALGEKIKA